MFRLLNVDSTALQQFMQQITAEEQLDEDAKSRFYNFNFARFAPRTEGSRFRWESLPALGRNHAERNTNRIHPENRPATDDAIRREERPADVEKPGKN
ncbi:MAG: hypothetical protein P4L51_20485 [Puia sp.]|nr:hypothetical protein [Puia sp.]